MVATTMMNSACLARSQSWKKTSPRKKIAKLSGNSDFLDEDDALMKAIALSLEDSHLDLMTKTPPKKSEQNLNENKKIVHKDDSGNRKRKNFFVSGVQMTEDELMLHFQFDEVGKVGITKRDLRRVAASHDFTWTDEEMGHMIEFFDTNGDGKLSLEDFTKIVERCNMRQGSEKCTIGIVSKEGGSNNRKGKSMKV